MHAWCQHRRCQLLCAWCLCCRMLRRLRLFVHPNNLLQKLRAQRSGYTVTISQLFPVSIALETVSVLKMSITKEVYMGKTLLHCSIAWEWIQYCHNDYLATEPTLLDYPGVYYYIG